MAIYTPKVHIINPHKSLKKIFSFKKNQAIKADTGGIKKNNVANNRQGVPGTSKVPIIGKVLSGKSNSDTMNELLVFIAPRIL